MKPILRLAAVLLMAGMSSLVFVQAPQDQFFDSNGVRIRYIEQGTGAPAVFDFYHCQSGALHRASPWS